MRSSQIQRNGNTTINSEQKALGAILAKVSTVSTSTTIHSSIPTILTVNTLSSIHTSTSTLTMFSMISSMMRAIHLKVLDSTITLVVEGAEVMRLTMVSDSEECSMVWETCLETTLQDRKVIGYYSVLACL